MENLPVFAFNEYKNPGVPKAPYLERAWAAALTLIIIVMVLNISPGSCTAASERTSTRDHAAPVTDAEIEAQVPRRARGRHRARRPRSPPRPAPPTAARSRRSRSADLDLFYGGFHAVKDVNMTIERNKVTALIGSSGCGKSTVPALAQPHARGHPRRPRRGHGPARGRGHLRADVDPVLVRRKVGMVFQAPNPFPTMSIYENVAAGLKLNRTRIPRPTSTRSSRARCAAPTCGTRSRTASASRARACRAASSSGSASRARSRWSPRCS